MSKKSAERRIPIIAQRHKIGWRKYKDQQRCIKCNFPQPKSERMPDFSMAAVIEYIEVKQSIKDGSFNFKDGGLTEIQQDFMEQYGGYIFLEIGRGRSPDKRKAYMIPYANWKSITDDLIKQGYSSFRLEQNKIGCPGTEQLFAKWGCSWRKGSWDIPQGHKFWLDMMNKAMNFVDQMKVYI